MLHVGDSCPTPDLKQQLLQFGPLSADAVSAVQLLSPRLAPSSVQPSTPKLFVLRYHPPADPLKVLSNVYTNQQVLREWLFQMLLNLQILQNEI